MIASSSPMPFNSSLTGTGGGGGVDGAKSGRPLAEQSVTTQTLAI